MDATTQAAGELDESRSASLQTLTPAHRATYDAVGAEWMTTPQVGAKAGCMRKANVSTRLRVLFGLGLIERSGTGLSGDGYRWRRKP